MWMWWHKFEFLQWGFRDKRISEAYWSALSNQWDPCQWKTMFQTWTMLQEYLQLKTTNWGGPVSYRHVHISAHTCTHMHQHTYTHSRDGRVSPWVCWNDSRDLNAYRNFTVLAILISSKRVYLEPFNGKSQQLHLGPALSNWKKGHAIEFLEEELYPGIEWSLSGCCSHPQACDSLA